LSIYNAAIPTNPTTPAMTARTSILLATAAPLATATKVVVALDFELAVAVTTTTEVAAVVVVPAAATEELLARTAAVVEVVAATKVAEELLLFTTTAEAEVEVEVEVEVDFGTTAVEVVAGEVARVAGRVNPCLEAQTAGSSPYSWKRG
jgi:hypothetical protein